VTGPRRRKAVTLIEALVALAILAALAPAGFALLRSSNQGAVRASETALAMQLGVRGLDILRAAGHARLAARALTGAATGVLEQQVVDDVAFVSRYRIDAVRDGLVQLAVEVSWSRSGEPVPPVKLERLVASPTFALEAR
jgi:type II secretory pathway pseudopilin PulG